MFEKIAATIAFGITGVLFWWFVSDADERKCYTAAHRINHYVPCVTSDSCRLTATEYSLLQEARRTYRDCSPVE